MPSTLLPNPMKPPVTRLTFRARAQPKEHSAAPEPTRPSLRLTRLMALALSFEEMLRRGEVADYAALAARFAVDRGAISKLMQLTLLAPDLQARLLGLENASLPLSLRQMLPVCRLPDWQQQRRAFAQSFPSIDG